MNEMTIIKSEQFNIKWNLKLQKGVNNNISTNIFKFCV